MGVVRDEINNWLPQKFRKFERWEDLIDIIAQLYEEMHGVISDYPNYLNVDRVGFIDSEETDFDIDDLTYSITTQYLPVAGYISIVYSIDSTEYVATDNGKGIIAGTFLAGTANYLTGNIQLIFAASPDTIIMSYKGVDITYLAQLEHLFNVPQKFRQLDIEKRKFFLNRIALLIQLIGLERSLVLIGGLLGITVSSLIFLYTDDNYDDFEESDTSLNDNPFVSTHIKIELTWDHEAISDYTAILAEFEEYFGLFRGIDIVVENIAPIISLKSDTPFIALVMVSGDDTEIRPQ